MTEPQPFSVETLIDILIADTDRLETVKYAEVGIPMFLVGEVFGAEPPRRGPADLLGAHFAQLTGALAMRKAELDLDDIAKLLEVLADRHFMPPGFEEPHSRPGKTELPLIMADHPLPTAAPPALAELADGLARSRAVRLVNFHATPRYREEEFRRQIEHYAKAFEPITPANFAAAVEGRWEYDRPGLMPALFEGYRDNLDVLLPILEEYGFTGWLFVPSAFPSVPHADQRSYAAAHDLFLPEIDEYPDDRIALTWDEARAIRDRGHVFACHTFSHAEVTADTPLSVLQEEILRAKAEMERELGPGIDIFAWLEGAELGVNPTADAMLRDAGFRYLFSNFKIQQLQ